MGKRLLEVAVLVAQAREEVKALLGAGGGDVQEARGLGVLGVGVEVLEVFVGEVLVGAGFLDGGQKQAAGGDLFPQEERRGAAGRGAGGGRGGGRGGASGPGPLGGGGV